jgi:glycosyltransferase involved in cell wall biosynthesis
VRQKRHAAPSARGQSVRSLTYSNYELVVQDGASTDGTLEYFRSIEGLPAMSIVSAPDSGIGQGFNRAVQRCAGDIIGSVDADNLLHPDALDVVVRRFAEHPDAAVVRRL